MEHEPSYEKQIGYEIASISNLMRRKAPGNPEQDGKLTRMQNWTIGYLRDHAEQDIFQHDIERDFKITGATATNILQRMERDGLLTREPLPTDRRKKKLVLTEKSIQISNEVLAVLERNEQLMRSGLSAEELEVFFRVTAKIKENLQK